MRAVYRFGAWAYRLAAGAASLWSHKARARVEAASSVLDKLTPTSDGRSCIWMHCASVGEFEQGRPVWDRLRQLQPDARFVLTFFSPSGYEQFSGHEHLGEVHYLPWDTGKQAQRFVNLLYSDASASSVAVFVKYEWWLGYFQALRRSGVYTSVISAAFRQNQPFFRSWGGAWREALLGVDQIFVSHQAHVAMLAKIGVQQVQVAGDTRVDRTLANTKRELQAPVLARWVDWQRTPGNRLVMVAGSTWPTGEKLLAEMLQDCPEVALIIAPHEVNEQHLQSIERRFEQWGCSRLSRLAQATHQPGVVLVDSIGKLSRLYRFGDIAYVGGGFGSGIHNTLEPAAYGLPTAVGPRHTRFAEAKELLTLDVLTQVTDSSQLVAFCVNHAAVDVRDKVKRRSQRYFAQHAGATDLIVEHLSTVMATPA